MTKFAKLAGLGLAMLLLWVVDAAWANSGGQESEAYALPETSVSATRWEQDMDKLARNVTVITRDYIEKLNPATVPDLLKGLPGIYVQQYNGNGSQASVTMRGFGENGGLRVLVTIDGRRQNLLDSNGQDWSIIPVDNIERIEVLHGPAAVIYGDNAVGGVINIITRRGSGPMKGKLKAQYGSYESYGLSGNFQGATDMADWFVSAHYDDSQGYRDNNSERLKGGFFNAGIYPTQRFTIKLDGVVNQTDFGVPGSLTVAQADQNRQQTLYPNAYYTNKNQAVAAYLKGDFDKCGVLSLDMALRKWESESDYWAYYDATSKYYAVQPKYVLESELGPLGNRLTAGLDYYKWDLDSDYVSTWYGTTAHDYKLDSLGAYLYDELALTKKLILQGGGRYQNQKYNLETTPQGGSTSTYEPDDDRWAWSAGLAYNFQPGSKVYGRVASAFRYPSVDEYASVSYDTFWKLEPEKALSYEIGLEWTFWKQARLSLAGYIMDMEDEIAYNSYTWANENLDETRHSGVEAGLHVPVCDWAYAFGSLTFQEAKFTKGENDGNDVPLVPQWMGSIGVNVSPLPRLNVMVRWLMVGERYYGGDYANSSDKMDAFNTFDASVNYKWDRYTFFVNGSNLFGEKYSTQGYVGASPSQNTVNPMPETQVWGGVSIDI